MYFFQRRPRHQHQFVFQREDILVFSKALGKFEIVFVLDLYRYFVLLALFQGVCRHDFVCCRISVRIAYYAFEAAAVRFAFQFQATYSLYPAPRQLGLLYHYLDTDRSVRIHYRIFAEFYVACAVAFQSYVHDIFARAFYRPAFYSRHDYVRTVFCAAYQRVYVHFRAAVIQIRFKLRRDMYRHQRDFQHHLYRRAVFRARISWVRPEVLFSVPDAQRYYILAYFGLRQLRAARHHFDIRVRLQILLQFCELYRAARIRLLVVLLRFVYRH